MKKIVCVLLLLSFFTVAFSANSQKIVPGAGRMFFQGSYNDFLREARSQKKTVLLDFSAAWAAASKKMDAETFTDARLITYAAENLLVFKVNIDTFDGMEIANKFNIDSFPTLVVLDSSGRFKAHWSGFLTATEVIDKFRAVRHPAPNLSSL